MTHKRALLQAGRRQAQHETLQEVRDVFQPWLRLPKDFGKGAYERLFSPLTHVLAVLVPGLGGGRRVSGDAQEVLGLAGLGEEQDRVAQNGGLL